MKRSEINEIIRKAIEMSERLQFRLPPFAYWTPRELALKDSRYDEFFDNRLGWDITDFGGGNFDRCGLTMLTIRNGNYTNAKYVKPYAEKILVSYEEQVTPYHYHAKKMEDIINRGGGNLIVRLYNSASPTEFSLNPVTVYMDGCSYEAPAGSEVRVLPGESITLHPGVFHSFWAEKGHGAVLLGEVSKVNDDYTDNFFYAPTGRFPKIEEDAEAEHLLLCEYDTLPRTRA